jgi:predicted XRE-type DNA-binding protein
MPTITEEISPDATIRSVIQGLTEELNQEQDTNRTSPEKAVPENEGEKKGKTKEDTQETKEAGASKDQPSPTASQQDLVKSLLRADEEVQTDLTQSGPEIGIPTTDEEPAGHAISPNLAQLDAIIADASNVGNKPDSNPEGEHSTNEDPQQPQDSQEGKTKDGDPTSSADYERTNKTDDSLVDDGTPSSKPLHNICLPTEVLQSVKDLTPEDALDKLLTNYGACLPSAADKEKDIQIEQSEHELRFQREVVNGDMFALLEQDPSIYANIKALFSKLQTPQTAESLFQKVSQAETLLEQYANNLRALQRNTQLRETQISLQHKHFEQATHFNKETASIKAASAGAYLQVAACEDNIAKWKAEIRELEAKIAQEEQMKEQFAAQAVEVPRSKIEELARAGLQHYSKGLVVSSEVDRLNNENNVLQRKLEHTKAQYHNFRQANKSD